jgi:hypothetical protein
MTDQPLIKTLPIDQWERIAAVVRATCNWWSDEPDSEATEDILVAMRALTPDDIEACHVASD